MSSWRVDRHYGFGAARIPLPAEFHRGTQGGLREGLTTVASEFVSGGPLAAMRRIAGQAPAIILFGLLFLAFVVTVSSDHSDNSTIEMVLLETVVPVPLPELPEIVPEVVPKPEPIPIAKAEPEPLPVTPQAPPPQLAERPPPPPPIVKPRPKPRPTPVLPQIAKVETPKPAPVSRPSRERVKPVDRARVAIDPLRPAPAEAPVPEQLARTKRAPKLPTSPRNTPRLEAPAAPAFDSKPAPAQKETFRLAAARPTTGARPKSLPGIAPAPKAPAASRATAPPPARPQRAAAPRAKASRRPVAPAPSLAAAAVPDRPAPAMPTRESRAIPSTQKRSARRPAAEMAAAPSQRPSAQSLQLASRADRAAPSPSRAPSGDRPGVAGVPLGDLAACVTDREEDRLKQAVVAAVKTQEECVSRKGTYRFVETKNLNSFLMWIDRAPSRPVEDRCAELHNALECLQSARQRAAR